MAQKQLKSIKDGGRQSNKDAKNVDNEAKEEQHNSEEACDRNNANQPANAVPSPAKPPRLLLENETESKPQQLKPQAISGQLQQQIQQKKPSDISPNVSTVTDENTSRLSTFGSQLVTSTPNGGGKDVTAAVSSVTSPSSVGSQRSSRSSLCTGDEDSSGHVADSLTMPSANARAANQESAPVGNGDDCNNSARKKSCKKIPPPPPPRKGSRVTMRSNSSSDNPYVSVAVNQAQAPPMSPPTYENIQKYSGGFKTNFDPSKSSTGLQKSPSRIARSFGLRENIGNVASATIETHDNNVTNTRKSRVPTIEAESSDSSANSQDTIKHQQSTKVSLPPSIASASPKSPTSPKSIMKQPSAALKDCRLQWKAWFKRKRRH